MGNAELGEHARGVLRRGELFLGAKDLQHPAGPVIEGDAGLRAQVLETGFAVVGDALHARLVAGEALRCAVAQELEEPSPLIGIEPRTPDNGRVTGEQPARNFRRHSRRRPRARKSGADAAGIGEARLQRRAALAIEHDHVVTGLDEMVGAARPDDARAQDHHAHDAACLRSIDLDLGVLDDFLGPRHVVADVGRELFSTHPDRIEAERVQSLLDVRKREHLGDIRLQLGGDIGRQVLRSPQSVP